MLRFVPTFSGGVCAVGAALEPAPEPVPVLEPVPVPMLVPIPVSVRR